VEAEHLSREVVGRFLRSPYFSKSLVSSKNVALYRALPRELDLSSLEPVLIEAGAKLLFPRMGSREAQEPEFVEVDSDTAWETGPYGIREPHRDHPAVDPASIHIVFVPGTAYGTRGERVGMGRGHYDRFLARVKAPIRVALSYDFQLFERIETEAWDQPVDWIVTEKRDLRLGPVRL
jgi:5-formyltetrahydrofolate cyclo-ligase